MPLISTMIRVVRFLGGSSTRNRTFFLTPQNILIERENVPSRQYNSVSVAEKPLGPLRLLMLSAPCCGI